MSDPREWTVSDVGNWLGRIGQGEYRAGLQSARLDGHMLSAATEQDLEELGVTIKLHRFKIVDSFRKEVEAFGGAVGRGYQPYQPPMEWYPPPPPQWGPPGPPPHQWGPPGPPQWGPHGPHHGGPHGPHHCGPPGPPPHHGGPHGPHHGGRHGHH